MLLILSARYVNEDIALHYGRVPPSFLPLGAQRLFSLQAEQVESRPIFMTVPDTYEISQIDMADIEAAGITLVAQSSKMSLTQALRDALGRIGDQGPLRILYGDTLIRSADGAAIDNSSDRVMVQTTNSNYPWAYVVSEGTKNFFSNTPPDSLSARRVVCGDYVFADVALLAEACEQETIIDALNHYNQKRQLTFVDAGEWLDFGHLPLYFQSKKSIMIKRVFNSLSYENHRLTKLSDDTQKIRAEANWYEKVPVELQMHTPRYNGQTAQGGRAGYVIEYVYHPLLSDLWVFGNLPLPSWLEILEASFEFFDKCQMLRPEPDSPEATDVFAAGFFEKMIVGKTWDRLETYCASRNLTLDSKFTLNGSDLPSLRDVVSSLIAKIDRTSQEHIRFWHGDSFFGNMFYDFTARRVMVIDPRGQITSGETCLYGDFRYDLAKLCHSVVGQYDQIILGRTSFNETDDLNLTFRLNRTEEHHKIQNAFKDQMISRYNADFDEILSITALLFFSMLPLHRDRPDLQKHMLANGLRLYAMIEGAKA